MNDELMDKLEPFPYHELKLFKTPYLAGYIAEKYSYTEDELLPRAKDKTKSYIDSYIASTVSGYTSVNYTSKDIDTTLKMQTMCCCPYGWSTMITATNNTLLP